MASHQVTDSRSPLFVRVLVQTGPNERLLGHVQKKPIFIGVNWEGLAPLP